MSYHINDRVRYVINDGNYMIVATRDEPYHHMGGDIHVEDGNDYVIVRTGTNDVESFIHVQEVHRQLATLIPLQRPLLVTLRR